MTIAALVLNLLLSFSSFAALALSLDRHHRGTFDVPLPRGRSRGLRAAGWSGLILSFTVAVACAGWSFGPVQWTGGLTGAGLAVVALISYRPTWLRAAALAALPLAAVALPFALAG
ncbi:DUF3325 domain-containing protein [Methylobacterium sp. NEAU K]|uniref:DUF3325 domain-containing protein n=1 Tax=Methylobacterium sp. NEAU K TaxID=3064946 RepID=UPI0027325497|nr:DUF3325 domain-containing protein [Methylobacterium sp. NEAU K]MDP4002192.1 DUF3325 domain-containing protein [Methylobacterium sp. NEAU K]